MKNTAYHYNKEKKGYKYRKLHKFETKKALSDFSVLQEHSADSIGFELFKKTHYDIGSAARSIDLLPREDTSNTHKLGKIVLPEMFGDGLPTHPKTDARVKYLSQLAGPQPKIGFTGESGHRNKTDHLWADNIKVARADLPRFEYAEYIYNIRETLDDSTTRFFQLLMYELGAAFQEIYCDPIFTGMYLELRKRKAENKKSTMIYQQTSLKVYEEGKDEIEDQALYYLKKLENNPEFNWKIKKNIGLICYQKKDYKCAKSNFKAYLEAGQSIPDKRYITSLINEINQKQNNSKK